MAKSRIRIRILLIQGSRSASSRFQLSIGFAHCNFKDPDPHESMYRYRYCIESSSLSRPQMKMPVPGNIFWWDLSTPLQITIPPLPILNRHISTGFRRQFSNPIGTQRTWETDFPLSRVTNSQTTNTHAPRHAT